MLISTNIKTVNALQVRKLTINLTTILKIPSIKAHDANKASTLHGNIISLSQ